MGEIRKLSSVTTLSREMAIMHGIVEPTEAEEAERAARREKYLERTRRDWQVFDAATAAMDTLDDPLARRVLDLHAPKGDSWHTCEGCDFTGYEGEPPDWPCRTVQAVAEHYGITLPDGGLPPRAEVGA